ncbi:MAG: hypothetical protein PHG25_04295 [Candidatus Pacebacteria bacterium]|nr:hypothetical protein [Candidatus Paceibacterota bacterium]
MAIPLGLAKAQGRKLGQPTVTSLKTLTTGKTNGPLTQLVQRAEKWVDSLPNKPMKKKNRHRSFKASRKK